jgi:predicted NUDIX family NTP pyrophosphohydrolase
MRAFHEGVLAAWFSLDEARMKIIAGQRALIDALATQTAPSEQ